jgi:hypothetical protein
MIIGDDWVSWVLEAFFNGVYFFLLCFLRFG